VEPTKADDSTVWLFADGDRLAGTLGIEIRTEVTALHLSRWKSLDMQSLVSLVGTIVERCFLECFENGFECHPPCPQVTIAKAVKLFVAGNLCCLVYFRHPLPSPTTELLPDFIRRGDTTKVLAARPKTRGQIAGANQRHQNVLQNGFWDIVNQDLFGLWITLSTRTCDLSPATNGPGSYIEQCFPNPGLLTEVSSWFILMTPLY
jgi:hypothetical protein